MKKPISLVLTCALALGGSVHAQTPAPPDPGAAATPGTTNPSKSDPSTATPGIVSPAHPQPDRMLPRADRSNSAQTDSDQSRIPPTRMAEAATEGNKDGLSAGAMVKSPAGETIGTVKDVVPDPRTGQPSYVLVATQSGANAAIPYSTIAPMFSNGHVVLDRSRLEAAPRVSDSQLRNESDKTWQQKAQKYWSGRGSK